MNMRDPQCITSQSFSMIKYICALLALLNLASARAQLNVTGSETVVVAAADGFVLLDDLINNGTVERISLTGAVSQSITGTGTINHLKLNKSSGTATISGGMQNITGALDLTAGTLAAGGRLTMKSDAAGPARVMPHNPGTGSVSGDVYVERFIPGSRQKQWRVLGFPYANNIPLSRISGIGISYAVGSQSMMTFNESSDNGVNGNGSVRNAGYQSFTAGTDLIPAGKGVSAWLYGPDNSTPITGGNPSSALTISSFGQLNESGNSVVMSTPLVTNSVNGWNLLANPFASTIDWHEVMTASASGNVASTLYRWNPQAADWSTYNPSGISTNNGSRYIESGSAFFIKSAAAGAVTLTIPQSAKTGVVPDNLHFTRAPFRLDLAGESVGTLALKLAGIRVKASGQGNPIPGEAYLDVSRADANRGWDPKYDGLMMARTSGASVYFDEQGEDDFTLHFDAPIAVGEKRYYPLTVTSPAPGHTTLELRSEGTWNPLNSVALIDKREGKTLLMKGGSLSYSFNMHAVKEAGRFLLAVNHVALEKDGTMPGRILRLLGNPVTSNRIDLLMDHPTAKPKHWELISMNGAKVAEGIFATSDGNIQYALQVPGMRAAGAYVLRVEMDNDEVQTVQVIRK
jgi:hypothetical protein